MPGKVFHVDDATHKVVTKYCTDNGLARTEWVARVLVQAVKAGVGVVEPEPEPVQEIRSQKTSTVLTVSVPKKHMTKPPAPTDKNDDQPWAKPPFWEIDD
jgi:hypothetical protein